MGRPVGLVLAGGLGRRIGRPKGDLVVGGLPLAHRAARVLEPLCAQVLISVRPGTEWSAQEHRVVCDSLPAGRGPLAGVEAAWRDLPEADLLVLACDYARVDTSLFRRIMSVASEAADISLVRDAASRDHPLVGSWRRTAGPAVRLALERGRYRVGELLARVRVERLDAERLGLRDGLDAMLLNVNRASDLERLRRDTPEG